VSTWQITNKVLAHNACQQTGVETAGTAKVLCEKTTVNYCLFTGTYTPVDQVCKSNITSSE